MRRLALVLKFLLERWIQRGVLHQLLFVTALVAVSAVSGGLLVWVLGAPMGPHEAIWWAFLRLTDPGYLGDDEGVLLRVVSTGVTVLGYVLFMGSLIAILTQWLSRTMRALESGLTPIRMRDHVVILGWTNRTAEIARELLGAKGRLTRFLDRREARGLRLVIQAEEVDAMRRLDLREHLGPLWKAGTIFLRSGSVLQGEHLERLDLRRASVVIVPGADFEQGGAEMSDTRVVKALLTLQQSLQTLDPAERPLVVAEMLDPLKLPVAAGAIGEPLELVASQAVIARLISQGIRHRRLMPFYLQMLTYQRGNSLYVREFPAFEGENPGRLQARFPHAVVLGVVRGAGASLVAHLNVAADFRLQPGDLLVLLAKSYADCEPEDEDRPAPEVPVPDVPALPVAPPPSPTVQRVLVLGWSAKLGSILDELASCASERFEVTVLSRFPLARRDLALAGWDEACPVTLRHVEGEFTSLPVLEGVNPASFDSVVFLASNSVDNSEEADARIVLGYVLLRWLLKDVADGPEIVVELLDPANSRLFPGDDEIVLLSPRIVSHVLAHVGLRRELHAVYETLFVAGGAEITTRRAEEYGLLGQTPSFAAVGALARARGETVLGLIVAGERGAQGLRFGAGECAAHRFRAGDELVVLAGQRDEPRA